MKTLVYLLIMLSLLAVPLKSVSLPIGEWASSHLRLTDFAVFALFAGATPHLLLARRRVRVPLSLWGIVAAVTVPSFIGLTVGKGAAIFRDLRTPLYYTAAILMVYAFRSYRSIRSFHIVIVVAGLLSVVVSAIEVAHAFRSIGWAAFEGSRRLGTSMATASALMMAALLALLLFSDVRGWQRAGAHLLVIASLVQIFVLNDARSLYLAAAVIFGFLTATAAFINRNLINPRRRFTIRLSIIGVCVVIVFTTAGFWITGIPTESLYRVTLLRRVAGLITPELDVKGAANRSDRILALSYGLNLAMRNGGLGMGYGDNDFVDLQPNVIDQLVIRNQLEGNPGNVVEGLLFFHNAYGWALGRLGLWCSIAYFGFVAALLTKAYRVALRSESAAVRSSLLGAIAFALYTLVVGAGGGGFVDYFGPGMVVWIAVLAFIARMISFAPRQRVSLVDSGWYARPQRALSTPHFSS